MDTALFNIENPKGCKVCKEEKELEVKMEATELWSPVLAAYVDAWECPECNRQIMRASDGEVMLMNPDGERF